ncbi:DUF4139 domain-containing protein [Roseibacterium sp. SDUM158016]|uniref:DUF4139 domain-containing protein n=1 Tax=Roseicyclus sediminis TaxID=2980997 RepID=UPI0021CED6AF|nr:DUF4139 domain-containing protein [Roseibacterium sp. SDUM158016]MCU4652408.1 DUF4139 domain-containing protein [Roseibacterium sp. SDUM158016]
MRFALSLSALLLSSVTALADDLLIRADIAEALVFAEGAEVSRRVAVDLPAGQHRLLIPIRDLSDPDMIQLTGPEGVRLGVPQPLGALTIPEGGLDTPEEAEARAGVDAAEDALTEARDALARRDAGIQGLETQLAWLTALARGGQDGAAMPDDPAQLGALLATLGTETARVGTELQAAREARRADEEIVEDRMRALAEAQRALADLRPFGETSPGILVEIDAAEAISGELVLTYLSDDALWSPSYTISLNTEAEALAVERSIRFTYFGEASWRNVAMRFSTAMPNRDRSPAGTYPDPARIAPPVPAPLPQPAVRTQAGIGLANAPIMMEPAIMEDEVARLVVDGLSVVYDYTAPVTVGPTGQVTLPLDALSFEVDLENRAVPRYDATAFLVAMGENDSGETILPGPARFFRDGDLMGSDQVPLIAAGADMEIAFGPLDHLRLTWTDLSLDEGDRGFFVSENEQVRRIAFAVENTSGEAETVRLLYATPFAEQEDLELDLTFTRAPDEQNIDDLRGVHAWNIALAPGTEERIEMRVDLAWPEDMVLDWRP